ncbi:hypothetical protein HYE82_25705, partial [Streptomyces sp. BR123]|nr:hypothetical protein [Streptomyces sp. BR123]
RSRTPAVPVPVLVLVPVLVFSVIPVIPVTLVVFMSDPPAALRPPHTVRTH